MIRKKFLLLLPPVLLVGLICFLSRSISSLPPLGKFLDPFTGVFQNAGDGRLNASLTIDRQGLKAPVHIFFDDRKVPHIYAENDEDLYFAQGYVTASLRLWQMDFLAYASAGRLSEIFSTGFLDYDRNQRRIGILQAAKESLSMMEKDTGTIRVLTAYTNGVNACIRQLNDKTLPLEYKLLDYTPEPWSNLKSVLIVEYMANMLSGYEDDLRMSRLMMALGEEKFNRLFPDFTSHISPVMDDSAGRSGTQVNSNKSPAYLGYLSSTGGAIPAGDYNPAFGSNSWAVSGKKTRSGHPILCSDPHLGLSLPATWLEMQLCSGDMNVYGVSVPGTPAIVIGFNRNIAWGITNGEDDVKDWYKLKLSKDRKQYELDGKWITMDHTVEKIRRKGQQPFFDTIYRTIHGPIVEDKSFPGRQPGLMNDAMHWELHKPSNTIAVFIGLNKARDYTGYKQAIRQFTCPIQNFTFACKDNTIAINHVGRMPVKWPGQGKFILDGSRSDHLYTRYIPLDSLPGMVDPVCNFVFSANQHPTYPGFKYYYNGYYSEIRANRIHQLLADSSDWDMEKMKAMQLDNTNAFAVAALPVLKSKMQSAHLTTAQQSLYDKLCLWRGTYDSGDELARLFELWWKGIKDSTWDELNHLPFEARMPDDYVLLDLIRDDPGSDCFDKASTTVRENAESIILEAFTNACLRYEKMRSEGHTTWASLNKVNIQHMARINAFSRRGLPSPGCPQTINAISSSWGPSWRMVVELGDRPRAFGIYPGGQSGNIGSRHYDDFIDQWNKGRYYPLQFFMSASEAEEHATNTWVLK